MADIRKQFSLDYLRPSEAGAATRGTVGSRALDEAVIVYSQPILQILKDSPNREMRAHDLVKKLNSDLALQIGVDYESLIQVINHLARLEFVNIAERDVIGNQLVRLLRTQ